MICLSSYLLGIMTLFKCSIFRYKARNCWDKKWCWCGYFGWFFRFVLFLIKRKGRKEKEWLSNCSNISAHFLIPNQFWSILKSKKRNKLFQNDIKITSHRTNTTDSLARAGQCRCSHPASLPKDGRKQQEQQKPQGRQLMVHLPEKLCFKFLL